MKLCIAAALIVSALLLSSCNKPADTVTTNPASGKPASSSTATPDELALANAHYAKHCSECHGAVGNGGLVTVDGKKMKVPSLREGHATTHTDEKLAKQISEGDDEMPAFKDKLSPQEIDHLVRLVRKEFQGK